MITWYLFRVALTRIALLASLPSVTQDALRARYSSLSLRGFVGGHGIEHSNTEYGPYGLALYLPRSTSIYPPHRTTSWIYVAPDQKVTPDLPLAWLDHPTYVTPHSSIGFNLTLPTSSLTSLTSLTPLTSTCSAANHCELMVHPTASKTLRPRYAIVRKRMYVPPRDNLDSSDLFFEPAYENTEEKLRSQAFYKQFFGRYYSMHPVAEERLSNPSVVLALVDCIGIFVCLLVLTAPTRALNATGVLAPLDYLGVVVRLVRGYGHRALAWSMQSLFLQLTQFLERIDKLEYASIFLAARYLDQIEKQVVETSGQDSDETRTPIVESVPAGNVDLAEEPMCTAVELMDDEETDEIDEQLVEDMIIVESPNQDEELEDSEHELNETQTLVEELACTIGEPMESEDVDEIEEQLVEAMVIVEEQEQDEEPTKAEEHPAIEQPTKDQVATSDTVAAESEETMDTAVDMPTSKPAEVTLPAIEDIYAKEAEKPPQAEESEPVKELALVDQPLPVDSLVPIEKAVTSPTSASDVIEEPVSAEEVTIEEPESASDAVAGGAPLRTRSKSCSGWPEDRIASLPLSRRASCSGKLPGYVRPFELPSLPPSPDLVQTNSLGHIEEPSFPRVERLPTDDEVLEKLDEVLAKINASFAGPCATQSSAPPPPPLLDPSPAPAVTQAAEVLSPQPAPRTIKVYTGRRALRRGGR
ncbi:hypothetical protein BDV93DRAFT_607024 [Ceratobasidium sp. AG-I]|nr:hypothetical protein BDV93DRAFT_607024 [Ceratobasidium sp. AG-I]